MLVHEGFGQAIEFCKGLKMANQVEGGLLSPWLQSKRINIVLPFLEGKILDFGCGNGALANNISRENYYGYDVDEASIKAAKEKNNEHFFSKDLPTQKFDRVVMLAVIEHVSEPKDLIRQLSTLLVKGGKIVMTTPHPHFDWIHEIGAKVGLFSHDASEEHEKLLSKKDIIKIAEELNLKFNSGKRFLFGANQVFVLEKMDS